MSIAAGVEVQAVATMVLWGKAAGLGRKPGAGIGEQAARVLGAGVGDRGVEAANDGVAAGELRARQHATIAERAPHLLARGRGDLSHVSDPKEVAPRSLRRYLTVPYGFMDALSRPVF